MNYEIDKRILQYLESVEAGAPRACREQIALAEHVRKCFASDDIYTDTVQLDKYLSLVKYFP